MSCGQIINRSSGSVGESVDRLLKSSDLRLTIHGAESCVHRGTY